MNGDILILATCILVLGITLAGLILTKNFREKTEIKLAYVLISITFYVVNLLISEIVEGVPGNNVLAFIFNLLEYYASELIIMSFVTYLKTFLKEKKSKLSDPLIKATRYTALVSVILITIFAATGTLFTIDPETGKYVSGPFNIVPYFITALELFEILALIIINYSSFTKRQFVVMILYEISPLPEVILELYLGIYSLTGIALTLSILLIYIFVQDSTMLENKIKQDVLQEISKTDLLTGLDNRRAYYDNLNALDKNGDVGIIYCDINGLKIVNDTKGHFEGDKLIKKFADLMLSSFDKDEAFRIAGDEFVLVLSRYSEDIFNKRVNDFYNIIKQNNHIAALGSAYGKVEEIKDIITKAEREMYKDKSMYGVKR